MIPVIMRLPITSAYELLSKRPASVRSTRHSRLRHLRRHPPDLDVSDPAHRRHRSRPGGRLRSELDRSTFKVVIGLAATVIALAGGIDAVMIVSVVDLFVLLLGAFLTIVSISFRTGGIAGAGGPMPGRRTGRPNPSSARIRTCGSPCSARRSIS